MGYVRSQSVRPVRWITVARAQARMWLRGYHRENPMDIDYGWLTPVP